MLERQQIEEKKRKNYPGEERVPGTKDYSVILGSLIGLKHQLVQETNDQKIGLLAIKIADKMKELGFKEAGELLKNKIGRKKAGKYQDITAKKKTEAIELAMKYYEQGRERNEKAKEENAKNLKKRRKTTPKPFENEAMC